MILDGAQILNGSVTVWSHKWNIIELNGKTRRIQVVPAGVRAGVPLFIFFWSSSGLHPAIVSSWYKLGARIYKKNLCFLINKLSYAKRSPSDCYSQTVTLLGLRLSLLDSDCFSHDTASTSRFPANYHLDVWFRLGSNSKDLFAHKF